MGWVSTSLRYWPGAGLSSGKHSLPLFYIRYLHKFNVAKFRATQPIVAVQNNLPFSDISVGMAILVFSQTMAGAVIITIANVIFDSGLKSLLPKDAPNVNVDAVILAGATGFRSIVSEADVAGVINAYAKCCDYVFYLVAGLGGVMFLASWGTGWVDIRKKKPSAEKV